MLSNATYFVVSLYCVSLTPLVEFN